MRNGEQMCNDVAYPRNIRLDVFHLLTKSDDVYYEQGYGQQVTVDLTSVYGITPQHLNWLEWAIGVSGDPYRGTLEGR